MEEIIAEDAGLPLEAVKEKLRNAEVVTTGRTLKVEERWRQGSAFSDDYECSVLYGADRYDGEEECAPYPYDCIRDVYFEPHNDVAVIRCRRFNDTVTPPEKYIDYFVFDGEKWLRIRIYK